MNARSYLFVPANRPERYAKALMTGAHAVIIDLEDAVAPPDKDGARDALAQWLKQPPVGIAASVVVRINAADTPWFEADLDLIAGSARVDAVMLPKADGDSPWKRLEGKPVLALVESAAGMDSLRAVASAPPVERLVFGSVDFQLDLGIGGDGEELLLYRSQMVMASRLANLPAPVDGVCTTLNDAAVLAAETQRARRLGFGGKLCIHPAQVATVNAAFQPSEQEVDWARRVIAADAGSGGAAVAVDGKMVDRPVVARARAVLATIEAAPLA